MRCNSSPYLLQAVIDNGVALVTSAFNGRCNVMTASFFAESSHIPVLVRVAIAPSCLTHDLIVRRGWFGLSLLSEGQEELALSCGSISGRELPKFQSLGLRYHLSAHGVPLLPDCLTTSECRVIETTALADHTLFTGEIVTSFRQSTISYRKTLLVSDLVDYLKA